MDSHLDIAATLSIATSSSVMNLCQYISSNLGYNYLKFQLLLFRHFQIPEGCTQLVSITELYLNDTFLEFLPANFGRLAKLRILELRENGLSSLPKSLSR